MKPLAHLEIQYIKTDELLEYPSNAKLHPSDQIDQIAASIEESNFNNPILAWHNDDGEPEIVAGHGRLLAARKLGMEELPVVFLDHMSEEQRRAYIIVDNFTNRKLGSDMGDAITGGGLHGKDLSKADVSVNIACHVLANRNKCEVEACCAIGDEEIRFGIGDEKTVTMPYSEVVDTARDYVAELGGFEKLAEWGLV